MSAMAAQEVGTWCNVPLNAPQGFGQVLGEKGKHEAVASESRGKPPLPSGEKRNDKDVVQ